MVEAPMQTLLTELKRRNIFRAAATYAVSAWVLAQAAGLFLPAFDAADWVLRAVFVVLALGFPVTIAAAWLYEITPRGLRRTDTTARREGSGTGPRAVDSVIIIALVIAVVLVGIGRDGWLIGLQLITSEDVKTLLDAGAEEQKVVVVPFVSVNSDPDSQLIAEGLTVALADRLQSAHGLSVIGLAANPEAQRREGMADVAGLLGAGRMIEGSLRRNGDSLIITAQLMRTAGHETLATYSEEVPPAGFERALDRIARKLASAAGARAPDAAAIEFATAEFTDWLRILGALQRGGAEDLRLARELARGLSDAEPRSGHAQAAQGIALLRLAEIESVDFDESARNSLASLDRAMSLAPESRRVLRWRASARSRVVRWRGRDVDFRAILDELDHALELFPGDPVLLGLRTRHCALFGNFDCAISTGRRALEVNPFDYELHLVVVDALVATGRNKDAVKIGAQLRRQGAPADFVADLDARVAQARGEWAVALQELERIERPDRQVRLSRLKLVASLGRISEAQSLLAGDAASNHVGLSGVWAATLAGDFEAAYRQAAQTLRADAPEAALQLGQLAAQAGAFDDAVSAFDRHFTDWLKDSGPLLGPAAWTYAPWYALALAQTGRGQEAGRLLDRHLAGVLVVESTLEAARRNLYLAANHAVAGRSVEAAARLEQAGRSGLATTFGVLGGLHSLADCRILGEPARAPGMALVFEGAGVPGVGSE